MQLLLYAGGTVGARTKASLLLVLSVFLLLGCSSTPELTHTGFLSDYSRLERVSDTRVRFESPRAQDYRKFIVDPVVVSIQGDRLSAEDRAEAKRYFAAKLREDIQSGGFMVVTTPGPGVARVRVALTDVTKSTWWKKVHPVSRVAGAGTGGAAMEAELLDSLSGEQIGAVVQSGTGNQFDFTAFSTLADIKSAIDRWSAIFVDRLKELRAASAQSSGR